MNSRIKNIVSVWVITALLFSSVGFTLATHQCMCPPEENTKETNCCSGNNTQHTVTHHKCKGHTEEQVLVNKDASCDGDCTGMCVITSELVKLTLDQQTSYKFIDGNTTLKVLDILPVDKISECTSEEFIQNSFNFTPTKLIGKDFLIATHNIKIPSLLFS